MDKIRQPSFRILDEAPVLLAVEGALVLQPAPVVLDTGNLLAVVVGNRVLRAARGRVSAVALDASVEALLLLLKIVSVPHKITTIVSDNPPEQSPRSILSCRPRA